MIAGQLWFQLNNPFHMVEGLGIPLLLEKSLPHPHLGLPCVRILQKIVLPKRFFVAEYCRPGIGICSRRAKQKSDYRCGCDFNSALRAAPKQGNARAE